MVEGRNCREVKREWRYGQCCFRGSCFQQCIALLVATQLIGAKQYIDMWRKRVSGFLSILGKGWEEIVVVVVEEIIMSFCFVVKLINGVDIDARKGIVRSG